MSTDKKSKGKFKQKHPGIYLLFRTLNRVIHRDGRYVNEMICFGDEPDKDFDYIDIKHNGNTDYGKIIYVVTIESNRAGFCATLRMAIGYLLFAKEHGFAPIIKLPRDFIYYDEEISKEISNPWEYYFEASGEEYEEDLALNVCYSMYQHMTSIKEFHSLDAYLTENYYDEKLFQACSPIISNYLVLKPEIVNEATIFLNKSREKSEMILGVHFRGTDYKKGYNSHPVFIDEKTTIEEIKKAVNIGKFKTVFLATDDASVCGLLKENLPGISVLMYPDVYRSNGSESVAFSNSSRKNHHYLLGYEIARDMYTLSLCDGLIAGKSSVSFMSNLYKHSRNEKYEFFCILDNGNNSNDNEF